jgi:hypothetical protein
MTTWRDRQAGRVGAKPLAWLPNRDGFKFVGVKHDGTTAACEVKRLENGSHVVKGAIYEDLAGWRYHV